MPPRAVSPHSRAAPRTSQGGSGAAGWGWSAGWSGSSFVGNSRMLASLAPPWDVTSFSPMDDASPGLKPPELRGVALGAGRP